MMKVGITGGIGSGKSTVCRLFARLGVAVYDSDAGAKRLMTEDAELRRAFCAIIGEPVPGMAELVSGLAGRGYRPGFFSDTSVTHMEELRRKFPAASAVPDGIYSYRVHAKKPELPMFEAFEARFGVPAFYFDDRAELIEGARKHGWNAHRFVSAEEVDKILG